MRGQSCTYLAVGQRALFQSRLDPFWLVVYGRLSLYMYLFLVFDLLFKYTKTSAVNLP